MFTFPKKLDPTLIKKKLAFFLAKHLQKIPWIVFFALLIWTSSLFYFYVYLPIQSIPEVQVKRVRIDRVLFDEITKRLDERSGNIKGILEKSFPDPFR